MKLNDNQKNDIKASIEKVLGKSLDNNQNDRIVVAIEKEINEPLPEQILKCETCEKDIIAYGTKGEAFITNNENNKHYHMTCYAKNTKSIVNIS